jgi:GNAT superfamily N-acetyltransferase
VVALCHIYARPALEKPPEAVVQVLVVDRAHQDKGIGKRMMAAAERWAAARGFTINPPGPGQAVQTSR